MAAEKLEMRVSRRLQQGLATPPPPVDRNQAASH